MSVEQGIHERWDGYKPLCDLVPIDRVYTGPLVEGETPFVTMERVGDSQVQRTTEGMFETIMLRFDVIDDELSSAKQIAEKILDVFNRADFTWSRGKVLDMKPTNRSEAQDENNAWHIMLDYKIEAWQGA